MVIKQKKDEKGVSEPKKDLKKEPENQKPRI